VIEVLNIARQLLGELLRFALVALRPTQLVSAANLFLRRQLAMYVERDVKLRRPDVALGRARRTLVHRFQNSAPIGQAGRSIL
jgi:hypothetical protein